MRFEPELGLGSGLANPNPPNLALALTLALALALALALTKTYHARSCASLALALTSTYHARSCAFPVSSANMLVAASAMVSVQLELGVAATEVELLPPMTSLSLPLSP